MASIAAIRGARVLNSHLDWVTEFTVELDDGRTGHGASPSGETPSIYEGADAAGATGDGFVHDIRQALVGAVADQQALDALLEGRRGSWGREAGFALSVAVYEASRIAPSVAPPDPISPPTGRPPRLLFNVLNGGLHAYTNPVVADVPEFLVVPRHDELERSIDDYRILLGEARAALAGVALRTVGGNPVHDLGGEPNEAGLSLLTTLLDRSGLADRFDLMVDASAGDWYDGERYILPVSGRRLETSELVEWWLALIDRYRLGMVEDPFAETDLEGWRSLHDRRPERCLILGDNLTSTLPSELETKAALVDGVLVKPNQNGTISGTLAFGQMARERGLRLVASHRSIETDSPFLIHLARTIGVDAIKIGPFSDFSSVLRTNELLRSSAT